MTFTEEQKRIFQFVAKESGHGIIDAVAGAGKTTTIMECAKFVKDKNTILFCAFNNSISGEIARKFHELGLNEVTVKTIHALGRQILQDNNSSGKPINLEENKYRELLKSNEIQEAYSIDNLPDAKELLVAVVELYNSERPHMSISNFTPNHVHHSKTKTERLWKNYYRKQNTFVNLLQD
jgi:superfamily I DNA/RNA helicase